MDENGFLCNICNTFFLLVQKEAFLRNVLEHFRNPHGEYDEPFKCKAPNCAYNAPRYNSFKEHIDAVHPNGYNFGNFLHAMAEPVLIIEADDMGELDNGIEEPDYEIEEEMVPDDANENIPNHQRQGHVILDEHFFVSKFLDLFGRKDTSMQVAIDHISIMKEILENAKADLLNLLQNQQDASRIANTYFKNVMNTVSNIDTQYKLEKHLDNLGFFKEGEKVKIAHDGVDISLTLFPLVNSVRNFLQLPNVLNNIVENQRFLTEKSMNDDVLYNVINGPLWRAVLDQYEDDDIVIPLFLYEDDFNPDNGLGPHKKETELSAFYVSFPTLNASVKDSINHIFIAMMTQSWLLKKYTDIIMLRVVDHLRPLQQGIMIDTENGPKRVYIITIVVVGDNMALNYIEGFPQSLNSNGFCRVCIMTMAEWSVAIEENPNLLRNEHNYILGQHGVRHISLLNNIAHHKVYENQTVDITHDWKLGLYKDDLYFIINHLTSMPMNINLDAINNAIRNDFDYGFKDSQYKIPIITSRNMENKSISGYAREIWNTVSYLPFILSTFLDLEDPVYKFGLLMVDILDEMLKPYADVEYSVHLDQLIKEHNRSIMNLFHVTLKPKNHITTHYGRICLKWGPLKNLWTLPFETKHQVVKSYLVNDKNRINTTYSVSRKIAYEEARFFHSRTNIFKKIKTHGKFVNGEPLYYNGNINLPDLRMVKKVEFKGTEYHIDDYIFNNDKTSINHIKEILISITSDTAYVITEKFNITYVDAFRSYKLEASTGEYHTSNILDFNFPPINQHPFRNGYYFRFKYF